MFNHNPEGFEKALTSFWKNGGSVTATTRRPDCMPQARIDNKKRIANANRASLSCTREKAMLISSQYYVLLLVAGSRALEKARKEVQIEK